MSGIEDDTYHQSLMSVTTQGSAATTAETKRSTRAKKPKDWFFTKHEESRLHVTDPDLLAEMDRQRNVIQTLEPLPCFKAFVNLLKDFEQDPAKNALRIQAWHKRVELFGAAFEHHYKLCALIITTTSLAPWEIKLGPRDDFYGHPNGLNSLKTLQTILELWAALAVTTVVHPITHEVLEIDLEESLWIRLQSTLTEFSSHYPDQSERVLLTVLEDFRDACWETNVQVTKPLQQLCGQSHSAFLTHALLLTNELEKVDSVRLP